MRGLPVAMIAVVVLSAAAADADFVNGVERFNGAIQDTATWTWAPSTNASVFQNGSLTITGGSYTAHSFTLGVGQGVRANVSMPLLITDVSAYLLLADRTAGFSVPVFSDQNYLGVGVGFHPYEFHTGFPPVGSIGVGGVRGKPGEITTGIQNVVSIPQAIGSGSVQYILEMDRLDQTQFRFSAWSTSNVLLGTTVADMSMPRYPQDIPSNLYITLAGNGTWDDVTIVSVPESGIAGLVFGLGLTITCLRRTRVAVC